MLVKHGAAGRLARENKKGALLMIQSITDTPPRQGPEKGFLVSVDKESLCGLHTKGFKKGMESTHTRQGLLIYRYSF